MPPERRFASRNVLVVDHDKDSAERLARLLRRVGSEVQLVHDGPSALEVDRSWFRPHIVLIDLGLPGMDAYTVARLVRAYPYRKVAVGALAGSLTAKDRRRAKEAGFTHRLRARA